MARWITVKTSAVPFDYRWPNVTAITSFTTAGKHFVRDDVADFAVGKGFATEGKAKGSNARSAKGKSTSPKKPATKVADVPAPNLRPDAGLVRADPIADGAAQTGRAVDPAAG